VGPGIAASTSGYMPDPQLTLSKLSGGQWATIATNDNWCGAGTNQRLPQLVAARTGAGVLAVGSADAAMVQPLTTGTYLLGVNNVGATGLVLVEIYDAGPTILL